ncbi:McrC family protein [Paenibacillus vini]|uniref:Restriction endonuclease n=1 Tax=Paenibacillus vini TaxID=1476024 RepID=A0ABQ4MAC4_9BACL|nr:McrC family protein [Paenibacillus vini]GIP52927.1 hypothetical protein J42TS3_19620 [Paenibacillus vini]
MIPVISVREHEAIYIGETFSSESKVITRYQATLLEKFEREQGKQIFKWGNKKITPLQWVGVASIGNLQIEILPKLANSEHSQIRKNLLYMLTIAKEVPFRVQDVSRFDTQRNTFLEIFIKVFIDKLNNALKTGVIQQYCHEEENVPFLKGKLHLSEQLRRNLINKSRFYVSYDEYSIKNLPNRIIKATVAKLYGISKVQHNKKVLMNLKDAFNEVDEKGFSYSEMKSLVLPRTIHHLYQEIIEMCKIFWKNESPALSSGTSESFSLLFDMNMIYEKFIQGVLLAHQEEIMGHNLKLVTNLGITPKYLLKDQYGRSTYRLLPDNGIVNIITSKIEKIIDTKWKLLDSKKKNFGISQDDIYQMYAYAREYDCNKVILLYPVNEGTTGLSFLPRYRNNTFPEKQIEIIVLTVNLGHKFPDQIDDFIDDLRVICSI